MKTIERVIFLCVAAISLGAAGCQQATESMYPGYVEGEYVRIASPYAGSLAALSVKRGDRIDAGAPLFALEQENERAAREEAVARVARAQSQLANLNSGKRPDEVAAIRAQLGQAEAAFRLSTAELKRTEDLVASRFLSPARLDEARGAVERDRARVAELNAQVRVANLSARPGEIAAAAADLKAARDQLAQADWRLAQKTQRAPRASLVTDTMYNAGEWVQAGMPVVSLLPPENTKLRFFVPEKQVSAIRIGQEVTISCDGCNPIKAGISFISPQAEYTSPLIYSKENRATLVFLIEARARPEDAVKLHPGQPVEVRL